MSSESNICSVGAIVNSENVLHCVQTAHTEYVRHTAFNSTRRNVQQSLTSERCCCVWSVCRSRSYMFCPFDDNSLQTYTIKHTHTHQARVWMECTTPCPNISFQDALRGFVPMHTNAIKSRPTGVLWLQLVKNCVAKRSECECYTVYEICNMLCYVQPRESTRWI